MIPGPPARLGAPIAVDLPRPRTATELAHADDAMRVRAHVIEMLTAHKGPTAAAKAAKGDAALRERRDGREAVFAVSDLAPAEETR
jgi:hypothetical protein